MDHELPTDAAPPLGQLIDVAGRRLAMYRSGDGGPTVVLLPGAGLVGLDFADLQDRAAALTTAVLYDRAGTGWSDPVALPRTAAEVTDELRELLRTANVPGPYLLVGHSLGGAYARHYAQRFGAEVAGLLLLDPGHEDMIDRLPPAAAEVFERMKSEPGELPEPTAEQLEASRAPLAALYARWPDAVRDRLIEHKLTRWRTGIAESANYEDEVYDELRRGGPLPDVPLILLTAGARNPFWAQVMSEDLMEASLAGVHASHTAFAASVPRGEHRTLPDAAHQSMHLTHADAILRALRDLLDRIAA